MKARNREGSGLLIFVIMISGLVLYLSTIWHATSYLVDISLLREQYEKEHSATLGLMNWALSLAQNNFSLIQKESSSEFNFSWPPNDTASYAANIQYKAIDNNTIAISVHIKNESDINCTLKSMLIRTALESEDEESVYQFAIHDWHYGAK